MARPEYSEFSATLTNETYSEAVNVLPDIRELVRDGLQSLDWAGFEAAIAGIEIRSESAFEVQFNSNAILSSKADGAEYFVHFDGSIDYVVFTESTTVTYIWVSYFRQAAQHVTVTLASEPSGATMALKNWAGEDLPPVDTNEYECNIFLPYIAVSTGSGIYVDTETLFRAKDTSTIVVKQDVAKLVSIAVTTPPTTTSYTEGETLDMTGIEVTATLANGGTEDVTSDCVFQPANGTELSLDDTAVLIYYTDPNGITRATSQEITVSENYILQPTTIEPSDWVNGNYNLSGDLGLVENDTYTVTINGTSYDVTAESIQSIPTGAATIGLDMTESGIIKQILNADEEDKLPSIIVAASSQMTENVTISIK